jgi:hypothetical protein
VAVAVTVTVKIWLGAIGVMIRGPSLVDSGLGEGLGAGVGGAVVGFGAGGVSVGTGGAFIGSAGGAGGGCTDADADADADAEVGTPEGVGVAGDEEGVGFGDAEETGTVFADLDVNTEVGDVAGDSWAGGAGGAADGAGGAADGVGCTVVYWVTITTGGGSRGVVGRAAGRDEDSALLGCRDWLDAVGIGANSEAKVLFEESREEIAPWLCVGATDAEGVGKTVVYSVFVTTSCVVIAEEDTAMGCSGVWEAVEVGACTGDKELAIETEGELTGVPALRDTDGLNSKPGKAVEFWADPPPVAIAVLETGVVLAPPCSGEYVKTGSCKLVLLLTSLLTDTLELNGSTDDCTNTVLSTATVDISFTDVAFDEAGETGDVMNEVE